VALGLGLVLLSACGGSAKSGAPEHEATGGVSASAGSTNGGGGASGANSDVAGAGNSGVGGVSGGRSGVAGFANGGSAGKVPDVPGGSAGMGTGPLDCSTPYAGPSGGPRSDGPTELASCMGLSDEVILARYKDYTARVPRGLYYEPSESITFWNEPCSESPEQTVSRGPTDGNGTFLGSYSSEWFYEAVYCYGGVRRIERNLRCDYFDGSKLANASPERLAFLASMLWWSDNGNLSGSAILGHSVAIGDATDVVNVCTIRVTFGDFGLCDQVQLENTAHRLRLGPTAAASVVQLGKPEVIRTLEGDCH